MLDTFGLYELNLKNVLTATEMYGKLRWQPFFCLANSSLEMCDTSDQ